MQRASGLMFGRLAHHYFRDSAVVLKGEGQDGTNLVLAFTERWGEANRLESVGVTPALLGEILHHVSACESECCKEAHVRYKAVEPFIMDGTLPGGGSLALVSVFQSGYRGDFTPLSRKNGFGDVIDALKPFILWFLENEHFWEWPELAETAALKIG